MSDFPKDPLYPRHGVYAAGSCSGCHFARGAAWAEAVPVACPDCGRVHEPASITAPSAEDMEVSRLRALNADMEACHAQRGKSGVPRCGERCLACLRARVAELEAFLGRRDLGPGLREKLAALAHEQWSGWMRYLFSKTTPLQDTLQPGVADRSVIIPTWAVVRWKRQLATPYEVLSEEEKESDRKEADRVLAVLRGASHG